MSRTGRKSFRQRTLLTTLALFIFAAVASWGEDAAPFRPFEKKEYAGGGFTVTSRTYSHGKVKVKVTQAKRIGSHRQEPPSACRAWLEVVAGGKTVWQRYFDDIDAMGSSYGLFVPPKPPSARFFTVVKNRDYDGRLFLIDRDGTVSDLPGGLYFVSSDGRYLFSEYIADTQEVVVFDLATGKVVLDTKTPDASLLPGYIYDWYYDGKRYFFTIVKEEENRQGLVLEDRRTLYEVNLAHPGIDKVPADFSRIFHKNWDFDPRKYKDCCSDRGTVKEGKAGGNF